MKNKYGFIVEGTRDTEMVQSLFLNTYCISTGGTRFNNRCRINTDKALETCEEVFILTDPDEAGDILAEMIRKKYPNLRRILLDPAYCTENKMSWNGKPYKKTGVENSSFGYLNMAIRYYIEHPDFTGYPPVKSELKLFDI